MRVEPVMQPPTLPAVGQGPAAKTRPAFAQLAANEVWYEALELSRPSHSEAEVQLIVMSGPELQLMSEKGASLPEDALHAMMAIGSRAIDFMRIMDITSPLMGRVGNGAALGR
jgi:hypothetical protein